MHVHAVQYLHSGLNRCFVVYVSRLVHQYVVKLDESSENAISKDKTFLCFLLTDLQACSCSLKHFLPASCFSFSILLSSAAQVGQGQADGSGRGQGVGVASGDDKQMRSPLMIIESFLSALTSADKDGRIVVTKSGIYSRVIYCKVAINFCRFVFHVNNKIFSEKKTIVTTV